MGDAGEMLVPAELTLHRVPAFIVPSQWRGYVVGQCPERGLQRISVTFDPDGEFKSAVGTKRTNQQRARRPLLTSRQSCCKP
jgi:hypothetical protein